MMQVNNCEPKITAMGLFDIDSSLYPSVNDKLMFLSCSRSDKIIFSLPIISANINYNNLQHYSLPVIINSFNYPNF